MKLNKKLVLLIFTVFIALMITACGGGNEEEEGASEDTTTKEQVVNLPNGDIISTMDPAMATDEYSFQFLSSTMEGLYRLGENAEITEGIAINHDVSDDGLTWTFHLREDAVWSNGDPVTAHDFVFSWQRTIDPETASEYGPYMMSGVIKNAKEISEGEMEPSELGVTAEDDYTLVVQLENPAPYFESLTTFGTFYPLNQKFVEEKGNEFATNSDNLLANGPFILTDWESTSHSWNLEKNTNYWDKDAVQLDKLTFDVLKDTQSAVDLYERGDLDRVDLSADLVDQYRSSEEFETSGEAALTFLKFNQTGHPALQNKNIRKAISRAVDKQALVDHVLNNGSIVSNGAVPQDFVYHPETDEDFRDINGDLVTYNTEEALQYWEQGLSEIGEDSVELEIIGDDSETAKTFAEYVSNQLETNLPGLDITIRSVPFEQRLDLTSKMEYDIVVSAWGADFLDAYGWLNLWLTDGGNNETGYSNPEYDELVISTVTDLAQDPVARFEASLEAEKILLEDAVIAPLYQKARAQLVSSRLQGVIVNPFGAEYEYKWAYVE